MLFIDPVIMKMTIIDHVPPWLQRREDFLKNNILKEKLFRTGMAGMEIRDVFTEFMLADKNCLGLCYSTETKSLMLVLVLSAARFYCLVLRSIYPANVGLEQE